MKRPYKIVHETSTASSRELAEWLAKDGQLLVPLVELLEKGERAIDEVIDVMGRATVEAVLQMSAEQVAGPKAQGRRGPDREVYWHGVQGGRVALKERQLRVAKPRLRKKRRRADESGEVEVPAYTALQADQRLSDRMLELMLKGVSTRRHEKVLPAMADQVGISKSEVSRETIEAGTRVLQRRELAATAGVGDIGGRTDESLAVRSHFARSRSRRRQHVIHRVRDDVSRRPLAHRQGLEVRLPAFAFRPLLVAQVVCE